MVIHAALTGLTPKQPDSLLCNIEISGKDLVMWKKIIKGGSSLSVKLFVLLVFLMAIAFQPICFSE